MSPFPFVIGLNDNMLPVSDVTPAEAKLAEQFMVIGRMEAKDGEGKRLAWNLPARIAVLLARHVLGGSMG